MPLLKRYSNDFSNLRRNVTAGQKAPHKVVLLLAVIDLIAQGHINGPEVVLDKQLKTFFNCLWARYVGESSVYKPTVKTPFIHMESEPFWILCDTFPKEPLRAQITPALYELLQDENNRAHFRRLLISLI